MERRGILSESSSPPIRAIKVSVVVLLFSFSGIFFKTGIEGKNSVVLFLQYFQGIFTFQAGKTLPRIEELTLFFIITMLFNFIQYKEKFSEKTIKGMYYAIPVLSVLLLLFLGVFGDGGGDFIYFQF